MFLSSKLLFSNSMPSCTSFSTAVADCVADSIAETTLFQIAITAERLCERWNSITIIQGRNTICVSHPPINVAFQQSWFHTPLFFLRNPPPPPWVTSGIVSIPLGPSQCPILKLYSKIIPTNLFMAWLGYIQTYKL